MGMGQFVGALDVLRPDRLQHQVVLVESVPNVSEGRRLDVVDRLADAITSVPGVFLLDRTSDASHNRSVFTLAGEHEAVCDALDRFHIVAKKDLYPSQLSGGQQQLVGVARALVARPAVILADEPTGNLHSDQGREIMELFKKLNAEDGVTIVQVTHSEVNAAYGSRIVRLADGMLLS